MYKNEGFIFREPTVIDKVKSHLLYSESYANNRHVPVMDSRQEEALHCLKRDGYVILKNYISPEQLGVMQSEFKQALRDLKFKMPCLAQKKIDPEMHGDFIKNHLLGTVKELEDLGLTLNKEDAVSYEQVVDEFNPSTLTVPMLELSDTYRKAWLDPYLLTVIAAYLGMVPKLVEAYVRRNFPAPYKSMNHYWHRDLNHDFHLIKMFFFLSDCTAETGPHEYIRGSHSKFDVLNGERYFKDTKVDGLYPPGSENRILSVVPAGTVVIEDTRGVHRANVPIKGYRDLGFAVFMPLRPFYARKNYSFPALSYDQLTPYQKAFVPTSSLD